MSLGRRVSFAGGDGVMAVKIPDIDQWMDAMAPVVGLAIPDDRRPGVKANLKTAAKMAALLDKVIVKDETEPAPVYRA